MAAGFPTFKHFHVAPTTLDADTNPQRQHDTTSIANTKQNACLKVFFPFFAMIGNGSRCPGVFRHTDQKRLPPEGILKV